jgi:hypothetical protein
VDPANSDRVEACCTHCGYGGKHTVYFQETNEFLRCVWCYRLFTNPETWDEPETFYVYALDENPEKSTDSPRTVE